MAFTFRDFHPETVSNSLLSRKYEPLGETARRANEWAARAGVRVINVETVVLPGVESPEQSASNCFRTSGDMSSFWYQFIRVWYEATPPEK
jgi:hypothetical protein